MKKLFYLLAALFAVVMVSCSKAPGGSNLDVDDPEGTLEVSETHLVISDGKPVKLFATYISPKGLYEPSAISIEPEADKDTEGNNAVFTLYAGTYTIKAGQKSVVVTVTVDD